MRPADVDRQGYNDDHNNHEGSPQNGEDAQLAAEDEEAGHKVDGGEDQGDCHEGHGHLEVQD